MAEMAPLPKQRRLSPTSNAATSTATASLDGFLKSALSMADPSVSIGLSLERILDCSPLRSDKENVIDSATRIALALTDAVMRSARKLATAHNSSVWPLSSDLTIKVFSMLDTESVCCAAATCTLFSRCASDPLCYANIDLTRSPTKVTNAVISTMIRRAAKNLQSIKAGRLPQDKKIVDDYPFYLSPLTWSCLSALSSDGRAAGLQQLHLYNLEAPPDEQYPFFALAYCKSLVELEIVGDDIWLYGLLSTICECCHSIERLCLDIRATGRRRLFDLEVCQHNDLIIKCPLLSSLALRGYDIEDDLLSDLIMGAGVIKSLDLSGSYGVSGTFLRNLAKDGGTDSLETLILRDCENLRAREVSGFLSAVLSGDWKALRYVDISNNRGLLHGFSGHHKCALYASQILQERPDIHLIADFHPEICIFGDCTSSPPPSSGSDESSYAQSSSSCGDASSSSDDEDGS